MTLSQNVLVIIYDIDYTQYIYNMQYLRSDSIQYLKHCKIESCCEYRDCFTGPDIGTSLRKN